MHSKPLFVSTALVLPLALALAARPAGAQEAATAPPPLVEAAAPAAASDLSLTFSPVHLLLPVVEVTAEQRVDDVLSAAAIGGVGGFGGDFWIWEVGAQLRYYALGSFDHGLQLGAELLYVHVSSDDVLDTGIGGKGVGLAVGPFVGYKYAADLGFTVDVQAGAQYMAIAAEAGDGAGAESEDSDAGVIPLVNLNLGWSF